MAVEYIIVAVLMAVIILVQFALAKAYCLFKRHLWIDEIVTHTLVNDPSGNHALRALIRGLDTNPPSFHLGLRAIRWFIGEIDEKTLRICSLVSVWAAFMSLYLLLRPIYGEVISFTTILALWVHPLIQRHAFEARMYGPWLASAVWFAFLLEQTLFCSESFWLLGPLAVAGVLVCTLHTLGPLSFGLIIIGQVLSQPDIDCNWQTLVAVAAGPIVFLLWSPCVFLQNKAYSITWVELGAKDIQIFLEGLFLPKHLVLFLSAGVMVFAQSVSGLKGEQHHFMRLAGLTILIALPLLLFILSYIAQPLVQDRYAMPALAAFSPLLASVISLVPGNAIWVVLGLIIWAGVDNLQSLRVEYVKRDEMTDELIDIICDYTSDSVVLFESPLELYVISIYSLDISQRCFALDFEDEEIGCVDGYRVGARDHMRVFSANYPKPYLMPWSEVRTLPKWYIVPSLRNLEGGFDNVCERYPGFKASMIHWRLYELSPDTP